MHPMSSRKIPLAMAPIGTKAARFSDPTHAIDENIGSLNVRNVVFRFRQS
jgi:hypothetical protein